MSRYIDWLKAIESFCLSAKGHLSNVLSLQEEISTFSATEKKRVRYEKLNDKRIEEAAKDLKKATRQSKLFWRRQNRIKKELHIDEFVEDVEKLANVLQTEYGRLNNSIELIMKQRKEHIDPSLLINGLEWPISAAHKLIEQLEESDSNEQ